MPIPPAPPLPPPAPPRAPASRAPVVARSGGGLTPEALRAGRERLRPAAGYPPPAFHFVVTFGTQAKEADGAFHEVSGLSPEVETEAVHEGGLNGFVHLLPARIKHPRLVLRRGIGAKTSRLVQWCQEVFDGGFGKPIRPQLLHVFLLDEDANPLRGWSVENAWPVKWEVDGFHAMRNQVAMEKIELAYGSSKRIT